jgi:hypothetical protein
VGLLLIPVEVHNADEFEHSTTASAHGLIGGAVGADTRQEFSPILFYVPMGVDWSWNKRG